MTLICAPCRGDSPWGGIIAATCSRAAPHIGSRGEPEASGKAYRIQILSVTKVLPAGAPDLKGRRDAYYIYANKAYKYCIGEYATREEAAADLPKIRKQFSGAFIIFAEK